MSVTNCEFTNSADAGVQVTKKGTLDAFDNNRIADNDGPPLDLRPLHLGSLSGNSTFENNGDSYVAVRWATFETVDTDATWPDPGIPYRFGVDSGTWITLEGGGAEVFTRKR